MTFMRQTGSYFTMRAHSEAEAHKPMKPMKHITRVPGSGRPIVVSTLGSNSRLGWNTNRPA
jgi:hypothetical protein